MESKTIGIVGITAEGASLCYRTIMAESARALLGYTTPEQKPDGYRAASPLFQVSSQTAPTLIVHGVHDQVVPIEQSLALFAALREHEVPAQFITYNGRHSFGSVNLQESRAIWSQVLASFVAQEHP